ncbi:MULTISPECIES: hypothetical protein [Streptomyces]|uniref:hypothetical protein n=1 Tax=Streptomyces TaxID=1883 RepID=UPI0035F2B284
MRLAELHALVGDKDEAARLYGLAAGRITGPESAQRAVALLERARELLGTGGEPESELEIDILNVCWTPCPLQLASICCPGWPLP